MLSKGYNGDLWKYSWKHKLISNIFLSKVLYNYILYFESQARLESFHYANGLPWYSQIFYQPPTLIEVYEYQGASLSQLENFQYSLALPN